MSTTEFVEIDDSVIADGGLAEGTTQDYDRAWEALDAAHESQSNIAVMVVDAAKGGLVVDLGVRGFIPKSQIATRNLNNLERYIGQTLDVKVLEVDREKGRVLLSERKTAEEKRIAQRAETLSTLEKGQLVDGTVRRITDFGAFVDIGGIDGLLHVSDVSWENVKHTSDVLKVGDTLQVKILKIENAGERISLGLKQLQDDPWVIARREIEDGQIMDVTITHLENFGAFAKVRDGVEGLIPNNELTDHRVDSPNGVVEVGQTVTVKVLEIRTRDHRMSLSIRQVARDRERKDLREFMTKQRVDSAPPTLGDLFGDVFSKLNVKK